MTATIILGIGLEYIDTVFQTIQNSSFSQYTIAGMKTLFDSILVSIEAQYRGTAPALLPLQMQDIPIEEDVNLIDAAKNAMTLLYEALVTPLYGFKIFAFIIGIILWILDLFIYPLF